MVLDICLLGSLKINKFFFKYKKNIFIKLGVGFVLFAIVLIIITVLNTNYIIDQSYTTQDLRYDFNYAIYSAALIKENGDPADFVHFIKKNSFGLNLLLIQNNRIVEKYPTSFFNHDDLYYTSFSEDFSHPYSSFSDFYSLADLLENITATIPEGVTEISSGSWFHSNGLEYGADFIETSNGSLVYIVSDEPFEEVGFFSSLGQGFVVGVLAIIVFITLIYYYIRLRLKPIQLMKNRVLALQKGDLDSKIEILGTDELAELSVNFNKLISDIKNLIDEKHRVLLDVSHELKTPLTRMKLLLEMMPDDIKKSELKAEINFLNEVISNLLLSDKLDIPYSKLDLKRVDFILFIKNILAGINEDQLCLKNSLKLSLFIDIDETKLTIAIRNIIYNALKYGDPEKEIVVSVYSENNYLYISVRDFGPGINKQDVEKIFTPFFRSEKTNHFSGVGLGLSIAKKIMKAHKGNIQFNPKTEDGSEFILSLPIK